MRALNFDAACMFDDVIYFVGTRPLNGRKRQIRIFSLHEYTSEKVSEAPRVGNDNGTGSLVPDLRRHS